jgi:hypothetical protein
LQAVPKSAQAHFPWPKTILFGRAGAAVENGRKTGVPHGEIAEGFWPPPGGKIPYRAGLYARVSTQDQQTIPMQTRALREYATRRGWTIARQVKEIGSGASQRERREQLLEAARRREIDVVLVWRLETHPESPPATALSSFGGPNGRIEA